MPSPEELARQNIDALLTQCGWIAQNRITINLTGIRVLLIDDRWGAHATGVPRSATRRTHAVTPDDGRKFTELYNVQHLQSAQLDTISRAWHLHHPAPLVHAARRFRQFDLVFFEIKTACHVKQSSVRDRQHAS
jgi:hypothetical protein